MALLWTDGFDRYSVVSDLTTASEYTIGNGNAATFNTTGGVVNNGGNWQTAAAFRSIYRTHPTASTLTAGGTVHASIWVFVVTYPSFVMHLIAFSTNLQSAEAGGGGDANNSPNLWLDSNGQLNVNKHGAGTTVAISGVGALQTGAWHHIEYAAKWNTFANGGFIKVWVDGNITLDTTLTSQDCVSGTVPSTWTNFKIGGSASNTRSIKYDDVVLWDEVGTDFALTRISASYLPFIETLAPDGDDTVQFTKSTGATNASNVDDTGAFNGDTDYNYSSTVGQEDLLTVANPATTPAYVFAITLKTEARMDAAGILNLRTKIKSGTTVTYSSDRLLGTSYVRYYDFFGKDPDTSAVWAVSAPAALKVGYKYQS